MTWNKYLKYCTITFLKTAFTVVCRNGSDLYGTVKLGYLILQYCIHTKIKTIVIPYSIPKYCSYRTFHE